MTTRREVIRAASGAMTIMFGGLQIACTRDEVAVVDAVGAGDAELLTLVALMQRLLPHDELDPGVYSDAVQAFMATAADEPAVVAGLEDLAAVGFLDMSADAQVEAARRIENTAFFNRVRAAAMRSVYADERTWDMLGYGGDASRFGGYIDRGFGDIDWLPEPKAD